MPFNQLQYRFRIKGKPRYIWYWCKVSIFVDIPVLASLTPVRTISGSSRVCNLVLSYALLLRCSLLYQRR